MTPRKTTAGGSSSPMPRRPCLKYRSSSSASHAAPPPPAHFGYAGPNFGCGFGYSSATHSSSSTNSSRSNSSYTSTSSSSGSTSTAESEVESDAESAESSSMKKMPPRHVVFCNNDEVEVHPADEWDRSPVVPSLNLSIQEILELEAIQRSLPRAHQLPGLDPYTGKRLVPTGFGGGYGGAYTGNGPASQFKPQRTYLPRVPMMLLPLLPQEEEPTLDGDKDKGDRDHY